MLAVGDISCSETDSGMDSDCTAHALKRWAAFTAADNEQVEQNGTAEKKCMKNGFSKL